MPAILSIFINGKKVLDFDKNARQPGQQRKFLDGMDLDMDEGIEINGEMISTPNKIQRANYVAMSLLYGIHSDSESMISATCCYLANRLPELKQIRSIEDDEEITMELIFDEIN